MQAARLLLCSFVGMLAVGMLHGQSSHTPAAITGSYVGLEKMETLSPEDPLTHWFHENSLFVRNNEFILDQAPVTIRKGRKTYSASDGGFLVYRGKIFSTNKGMYAAMRLFSSDYVIFRSGPKECEPYSRITVVTVEINGRTIKLNGVRYREQPVPSDYEKVWAKQLTDEAVEYNGKQHYIDGNAPPCPIPIELTSH